MLLLLQFSYPYLMNEDIHIKGGGKMHLVFANHAQG